MAQLEHCLENGRKKQEEKSKKLVHEAVHQFTASVI